MESTIILCCINQSSGKDIITEQTLEKIFSPFGKILEVYIFSKDIQIKAFIKYENNQSLLQAIESLHNKKTKFGKMKTYVAQKSEIIRKKEKDVQEDANHNSRSLNESSKMNRKSKITPSIPFSNYFESLQNEELENNVKSENQENNKSDLEITEKRKSNLRKMETSESQKVQNENPNQTEPKKEDLKTADAFLNKTDDDICTNNLFDNEKSKVLILQKVSITFKPKYIANMFGCFGNVLKILINNNNGFCHVEFQNEFQADNAFKSLNNLTFFNQILKIKFSKYH